MHKYCTVNMNVFAGYPGKTWEEKNKTKTLTRQGQNKQRKGEVCWIYIGFRIGVHIEEIKNKKIKDKNSNLVILVYRSKRSEAEDYRDEVRSAQHGFGCGRGARINSCLRWKFLNTINLGDRGHGQKLGWKVTFYRGFLSFFFFSLPLHRHCSADSDSWKLSCYRGCHWLSATTQHSRPDCQSPPLERKKEIFKKNLWVCNCKS